MIKVSVIAVGKVKEKEFLPILDEYAKRLSAFCELNIVELKPEQLPEKPSDAQILSALSKEADNTIKKIPKDAVVFPLCVEGKHISSEEFSAEIKTQTDKGKHICFVIGSSYGLHKTVKMLGRPISFSDMTFPHKLFRIMLLEQIYRAFTIISGIKYHK